MHRSGGRQPPVVHGNARAAAWRNCSRDIRPTHWRAPAQLRYHHTHGGLTPAALALGESLPAGALRFLLHARFPNHGGLTPAALVLECERLPAKLRLLRCTNVHASGAGGVSLPRFAATHLQGLRANVGAIADRASADSDAVAVLHPRQHPRQAHARRSCVGMRTFAGEVATFAMHERTCTRSGGRQPPVARSNARAAAWRNCSGDIRPTHWRAPAQLRYHIHCGLTRGALASECERLPAKLRLLRCTNACAPGAGGVSPPWFTATHVQGLRVTVSAIADRASADPDAVAVLHPRQHSRRADARRSWLGESPPACAWRFLLHARSPNHGGLTPAALASECERLPAKLPLLRWTNACAPGAGGVSPPWFTVTHVQGRSRHGQRDCRPCISELPRSRGATSSTTFPAGSRPPLLCRNANVCRRNCDFCDGRTHVHRSGGRQPPVVHGNALARAWRNCSGDIRLTRCRAPAQSRYSHTHGGLTPAALVSGESPPACAWRFLLHARSRNHGGPRCGARDAVRSRWVVAVLCQRDCRKPAADRRALLVSQGSGPACALRFPLPVRSFEPGSANTLLCTAEVAFSPATE